MAILGRPTKYKPEYAEQYYKLALLGLTDKKISEYFEVNESTIYEWKQEYPNFSKAGKNAKELADSAIVESLYKRACGYNVTLTKKEDGTNGSKVVEEEKHIPADPVSMIFWLKNRHPELWRNAPEPQGEDMKDRQSFNLTLRIEDASSPE